MPSQVLKVSAPKGLSFSPDSYRINFDGKSDICSLNRDLNFITYFGITGKVTIANQKQPVKKTSIELISQDSGKQMGTTETDAFGTFSFSPVTPGNYKIRARHDRWHFVRSEVGVRVEAGNTVLPDNSLVVSGFDVTLDDSQPFSGELGLALYSLKGQPHNSCPGAGPLKAFKQSLAQEFDATPFCYAKQTNGRYRFENVAAGRYLIVPHYDATHVKLHIAPGFQQFEVLDDDVTLSTPFAITGMTLSGRVMLSQAKKVGLQGAVVKLNGAVHAQTDKDGTYVLENVSHGTYTLQVTAADYQFPEAILKIGLLKQTTVPDLFAHQLRVSGKVLSDGPHKVLVKRGETVVVQVESDPALGGIFSVFLERGKYQLEISDHGVQFFPQIVVVDDTPVHDIVFSQLRSKVRGEVHCLTTENSLCNNVEVQLSVEGLNKRVKETFKAQLKDGRTYEFNDILPGNYLVTVHSPDLCWTQHQHKLVVKTERETVAPFKQSGFKISIVATHDKTTATYHPVGEGAAKKTTIELHSGLNEFCVPKAGQYAVTFSGCHSFEKNDIQQTFVTQTKTVLAISAVKHQNGIREYPSQGGHGAKKNFSPKLA